MRKGLGGGWGQERRGRRRRGWLRVQELEAEAWAEKGFLPLQGPLICPQRRSWLSQSQETDGQGGGLVGGHLCKH